GFALQPVSFPADQHAWQPITPTTLVHDGGAVLFATDDWPFLYLRGRLIPDTTLRAVILMGAIGLIMVYLFLPKDRNVPVRGLRIDWRMFFLGAGFLLLETKAVVEFALLFGSTWLVNALVFTAVLVLILLANLYVLGVRDVRPSWHYAGLMTLLAGGA